MKYHESHGHTLDFDLGLLQLFVAPLIITRDPQNVKLDGTSMGKSTWKPSQVPKVRLKWLLGMSDMSGVQHATHLGIFTFSSLDYLQVEAHDSRYSSQSSQVEE